MSDSFGANHDLAWCSWTMLGTREQKFIAPTDRERRSFQRNSTNRRNPAPGPTQVPGSAHPPLVFSAATTRNSSGIFGG